MKIGTKFWNYLWKILKINWICLENCMIQKINELIYLLLKKIKNYINKLYKFLNYR